MDYFFIPGRIPSLSLLELSAVCRAQGFLPSMTTIGKEAFIVNLPATTAIDPLFYSLGGMIKCGKIIATERSLDGAFSTISRLQKNECEGAEKRVTFGISSYTIAQKRQKENRQKHAYSLQRAGVALKKELVFAGVSTRFVAPQRSECALSSVVVEKNHLLEQGNAEWVLLQNGDEWHIGKTTAVQEFEEFSKRDWHRPYRDMRVGLLPPKIARIMVNLSEQPKSATLLDPFCGLGTVLQEALLLGYSHLLGSDLEQKQVDATNKNIEWLIQSSSEKIEDALPFAAKKCDARKLQSCFSDHAVDAVITEPYLGPILHQHSTAITKSVQDDLCVLYVDSFREWKKILKKNGRIIIVFPVWLFHGKKIFLPCLEEIKKLGYKNETIPANLSRFIAEKTERGSIIIAREGQHVGRELFVFEW